MHSPLSMPLDYPFSELPKPGEALPLRPRLWWARLPQPFRLNHVNIWLLEDADGYTAIDAGCDTPQVRASWERLAETFFKDKPLLRIVLTHGHMDHIGAASWVMRTLHVPEFVATPLEWHAARTRLLDAQRPPGAAARDFMRRHGCADLLEADFASDMSNIRNYMGEPPDFFSRVDHDSRITMGGREWRVIRAGGHADGHASFYCDDDRILIAGDQILDRITPVVGVFPTEPLGDPLSHYLESLKWFRRMSEETLVLPSHGRPFFGLHRRLDQLTHHHEMRLAETARLVGSPASAREVATSLFRDAMRTGHARLGLAETLAHLHHLVTEGRARRLTTERDETLFHAV